MRLGQIFLVGTLIHVRFHIHGRQLYLTTELPVRTGGALLGYLSTSVEISEEIAIGLQGLAVDGATGAFFPDNMQSLTSS